MEIGLMLVDGLHILQKDKRRLINWLIVCIPLQKRNTG